MSIKLDIWKARKKELGLTNKQIAELANLPLRTVEQIMCGTVKSPRLDTVEAIERALGLNEKSPSGERTGKWINVYGHIAAGIPIEAIEDIVDQEEISEEMLKHGEYLALRVKGDSMEPKISDGDTVIIRIQDTIENGEIAAVYVNGNDVTLKRVHMEDNGLWLIGTNPAFTPIFYTKKQCAELPVRILGKMVELRAKF